MIVVVDANIAAALFLDLAYSKQAREAVARASEILAPDLINAEVANTLWKLTTSKRIDIDFARQVLAGLSTVVSEFVPGKDLPSLHWIRLQCSIIRPMTASILR
jgi:predicted nucleic acid-binding protein